MHNNIDRTLQWSHRVYRLDSRTLDTLLHWQGMSYLHQLFGGGLGSNEFHIK